MSNTDLNIGILASHNLWQSLVIFAVVFGVLKVLKDTSAEEKSWSWSATLFALAILPFATFLPGKGVSWQSEQIFTGSGTVQIEKLHSPMNSIVTVPSEISGNYKSAQKLNSYSDLNGDTVLNDKMIQRSVLGVWIFGMIIALFRLAIAAYNAWKLRKYAYPFASNAVEFDEKWPDHVDIAVSSEINGPMVVGFLSPTVLIPQTFAKDMCVDELLPLLYHELAHIKRHDNILHLAERIILALYWWNPIMHFIARHIAEERELACDNRAAKSCGDQIIYAKSLLNGARRLIGYNKPVLGMAVLKRESPLSKRIKRLTSAQVFEDLSSIRLVKNLSIVFFSIAGLALMTPRMANGQSASGAMKIDEIEKTDAENIKIPTKEELSQIIEDAMKSVPTEEELAKIIKEAKASMPSDEELKKIAEQVKAEMPDAVELKRIVEEAKASVPDAEELKRIIEQAKENVPTKEELDQIIEQAMANLPSDEELREMQLDLQRQLDENLKDFPSAEQKEKMMQNIQKDIENIKQEREKLQSRK
ncbi:MAG: hypothetical protein KDF58_11005 [Alphaproteobacteria bacterium]|nr:hypothetical protein [Alphaproteobacteria bacterium]